MTLLNNLTAAMLIMGKELTRWRLKLGSLTMTRGFRSKFFFEVSDLTLETFVLGGDASFASFASFVFQSDFWRFSFGSGGLSFEILRLGVGMMVAKEKLMDFKMFR